MEKTSCESPFCHNKEILSRKEAAPLINKMVAGGDLLTPAISNFDRDKYKCVHVNVFN